MVKDVALRLNLGCGFRHLIGWVNVDAYDCCQPNVVHDLDSFPYPWADCSIDEIVMSHVLEHLYHWWEAFSECSRILKIDGTMTIFVPDESSTTAWGFRDHRHAFGINSFSGIRDSNSMGTNAWAKSQQRVPMEMTEWMRIPYKRYEWMIRFPWLLGFCADHMRNFIHEQKFVFKKVQ